MYKLKVKDMDRCLELASEAIESNADTFMDFEYGEEYDTTELLKNVLVNQQAIMYVISMLLKVQRDFAEVLEERKI